MFRQHLIGSSPTPYLHNTSGDGECNCSADFTCSNIALIQDFNHSRQEVLQDIKSVVLDLALSRPIHANRCRHWNTFHLQLIRSHRLAPWLYYAISQRPHLHWNKDFLESLHKDLYRETIVDISREAQIKSILNAASESNINLVFLKGAYLAYWVYENPVLRTMNDVDILVHSDDLQRMKELLLSLGYINNLLIMHRNLSETSCTYHPTGSQSPSIDLHWQLRSMDYYYLPTELILKEVVQVSLFSSNLYVMSSELNFAHLALHTLNHQYLLRNWLDMVLLLLKPGFDWDRLLALAYLADIQRPLYWAIRELTQKWQINPPVSVQEQLATYNPQWIEDKVIQGPYSNLWRFLSRVRLLPSVFDRIQYIVSAIFPTRSYMDQAWGTRSRIEYIHAGIRKILTE